MRTLVTADLHVNDNPRDDYRYRFLRTFRDLCRKHKINTVIILGDLTDQKDRHSAWLVNQITDHFYKLAGICERVVVLKGNHDYTDPDWPFFRLLRRVDGVTYINTPTYLKTAPEGSYSVPTLFLPHTSNPEKDWSGLDTQKAELIFAHQTFNGASIGPRKLEGIDPVKLLPGKAKIISGDIHVPQTFGRVTYVGAPYLVDFGDDYRPRILGMFPEHKSISCPGPQKRLIEAASVEEAKRKCEKVAAEGDIMKIRISIDSMEHWPETKGILKKWCEQHGLIPYTIQPILKAKASMIPKRAVNTARSDEQVLRDYGKLRKVDEPVLKTGLELLEKT